MQVTAMAQTIGAVKESLGCGVSLGLLYSEGAGCTS